MAVFTLSSKNTTSYTNQSRGGVTIIWNTALFIWSDANGTWNEVRTAFSKQSKNTTSFTNQSKN